LQNDNIVTESVNAWVCMWLSLGLNFWLRDWLFLLSFFLSFETKLYEYLKEVKSGRPVQTKLVRNYGHLRSEKEKWKCHCAHRPQGPKLRWLDLQWSRRNQL